MPIKGLTDRRPVSTDGAVTKIGNIFVGTKKSESRPGRDLKNRFRVELSGESQGLFQSHYGTMEPKTLNVFFPFHKADDNMDAWRDYNTIQGLVRRCDGENIIREVITKTSYKNGKPYPKRVREDVMKPCMKKDGEVKCKDCEDTGYLQVLITELVPFVGHTQILLFTATGLNNVLGLTNQLRIYEQKYGSLKETQLPMPQYGNRIPFTLSRAPANISRPIYDAGAKRYTGGYSRTEAAPIRVTENKEWLHHWTEMQRRVNIARMIEAGQVHLLMDADRQIAAEMASISLPAPSQYHLPQGQQHQLQPGSELSPDPEPADTAEMADEDAIADGQDYRDELLSRDPKVRIGKVNEILGLPVEVLKDLRSQVSADEPQQQATEMIGAMLYAWGADNQRSTKIVSGVLETLNRDFPNLVDEDLAQAVVAELHHQVPMATAPPEATKVAGVAID